MEYAEKGLLALWKEFEQTGSVERYLRYRREMKEKKEKTP